MSPYIEHFNTILMKRHHNQEKKDIKKHLKHLKDSGKKPDEIKDLTEVEKKVIKDLVEEDFIDESLDYLESLDMEGDWKKTKSRLVPTQTPVIPLWKSLLKYAAVIVAAAVISIAFFIEKQPELQAEQQVMQDQIKLKTGNDDIRILNQGKSEQILSASGEVIAEQIGNKIKYASNIKTDKLVLNELEVPYGRVFEIELSDGTSIHLNSGTTVKYPIKFLEGQKREVYLEGEAYFNVNKDADHPFLVHSGAVTVEVLGTEFNVSSYPESPEIQTVLVEGSVAMRNSHNADGDVILKPGTKGAWNKTSHNTQVTDIDTELYTSWIKGELVFRDTGFSEVLKMLERRYNVTIENNNPNLVDKKINARFSVGIESIEDIMRSMGSILPYKYEIRDKKIFIN